MFPTSTVLAATAAAAASASYASVVPSLQVPACPALGTLSYNASVPDRAAFPRTDVALCYDDASIRINFTAEGETSFHYNASQTTNEAIWMYEVMEAFVHHGQGDPQTYLEFEVSPNNVTFQAFIYNPSKVRAAGAPFDTFFVAEPAADGFGAQTVLDEGASTWSSVVAIPLGLFNVDNGTAKGTHWRMNFFRTITDPATFPNQTLGAWNPPDQANFHMTPFFGNVQFV